MNKQTKTLISWAKKYLDCDSHIETLIEDDHIFIQNTWNDEDESMTLLITKNAKIVGHFVHKDQKWSKIKIN